MTLLVQSFPVMPTRPCSFCLSLQDASVFVDFDMDAEGIISLRRISYDGFGCCEAGEPAPKMNTADSRVILDAISCGELGGPLVEQALRKFFQENQDVIWGDALAEHDLL